MDKELLELQKMIEEDPQKITNLTDIELVQLNLLYDKQIQELNKDINQQKEIFKDLINKVSKQ